ncbi:MAG TPA: helix-hairpin-helix domain-containing protein, partial [Minicystis sp.]|nr:helix-hairpin-helix domain-containing protein [Minicystis sp.]
GVPGIGPATKTSLLRILGSGAAIRAASDEAILAVPGVTKRHLAALRKAFPRDEAAAVPLPAAEAGEPGEASAGAPGPDAPRGVDPGNL